ncbi:hypothetical protein LA080_002751 [Diaporthe eres]|nr:hypothetical protein LA080_002751 [Diaporthe eres]
MTSIKPIHGVTAGNISSHPSARPFCGIYIDMIVFDNAFQRLDMNFFYISQVKTASTGMRPRGGKSGGGHFSKELHTIRQDGTQCGAGEGVRAQTRLRLECKKHASGAAKMSRRGLAAWEGSERHFTWQSQRPAALSRIRYQNVVE